MLVPARGQRSRGGLLALLWAVAAGGTAGCERGSSILLVEVAGDARLQLWQLDVTVSAAMREKSFIVPPAPSSPVSLPASFSVELDPDLTGPVSVYVAAYDELGTFLGDGETRQSHINAGGQTLIAVMLNSALPPFEGEGAERGSGDEVGP